MERGTEEEVWNISGQSQGRPQGRQVWSRGGQWAEAARASPAQPPLIKTR